MNIERIEVYGSAGGIERTAVITARLTMTDCDTVSQAKAVINAAPALLKACKAALESGRLSALTPNVIKELRSAILSAEGVA